MTGEMARTYIEILKKQFGTETDIRNTEFEIWVELNPRLIMPLVAKPKDNFTITYTDNSDYLKVRTTDALKKEIIAFVDMTSKVAEKFWKKEEFSPGGSATGGKSVAAMGINFLAVQEFIEAMPREPGSKYWQEALGLIKAKAKGEVPVKGMKMETDSNRRQHTVIVVKDEEYVGRLTEFAMHSWEALKKWPEARDSLVRSLRVHGAQVDCLFHAEVDRQECPLS